MPIKDFYVNNGLRVKGNTLLNGLSYSDSASAKLHVKVGENSSGADLGNVDGLIIENNGILTDYALKIATSCGNIFNVQNCGFVGIGTVIPNVNLTVVGDISASGNIYGDFEGLTFDSIPITGDLNVGGTVYANAISAATEIEAEEFIGDLRGAVEFKAQAGEAISKGDAVYISGISGNTTVVSKADADDSSKMPAFGIASASAGLNNPITVYTFGTLSNIDTSLYPEGTELFVSTTPGGWLSAAPTGESAQIQKIAKVTRRHASSGSIKIMGAGRSNATPNLNEGRLFVGNSSNQAVADGTIHVDIANSRVGIGITSHLQKFAVAGSALFTSDSNLGSDSQTGSILLSGADSGIYSTTAASSHTAARLLIKHNSSSEVEIGHTSIYQCGTLFRGGSGADTKFRFLNDGTKERMRITHEGDIGIGVTNPNEKLTVSGNISGSKFYVGSRDINTSSNDVAVFNGNEIEQREINYRVWDTNATLLSGGGTQNYISKWSADGISLTDSNIFDNGTNVGIGTNNPQFTLDIHGDTGIVADSEGGFVLRRNSTSTTGDDVTSIFQSDAGINFLIDNDDDADNGLFNVMYKTGGSNATVFSATPALFTIPCNSFVDGVSYIGDTARYLTTGSNGAIRVQTASGFLDIGPQNTGYSHISTDRACFYLNKGVAVDSGLIGSYDEDLTLCAAFANNTSHIRMCTGAAERVTILSGGNVGIGTTDPQCKLDVNGNIQANGNLTVDGSICTKNHFRIINDYAVNYFYKSDNSTLLGYLLMRDDNNSFLSFPAAQDFRILHGNTSRIAVTTAGNVGIGTTDPSANLHIKEGSVDIKTNQYGLTLEHGGTGGWARAYDLRSCTTSANETAFFGAVGDHNTGVSRSYWVIGDRTEPTGYNCNNGIHLEVGGDVGIGTLNPAYKLDVAGTGRFTGLTYLDAGSHITADAEGEFMLKRCTNCSAGDDVTSIYQSDAGINFLIDNDADGDQGTFNVMYKTGGSNATLFCAVPDTFTVPSTLVASQLCTSQYLRHTGDNDTYFEFNGEDSARVVTGGLNRFAITNSGLVINDPSEDFDVRIESANDTYALFVNGSNDNVRIGANSTNTSTVKLAVGYIDDAITVNSTNFYKSTIASIIGGYNIAAGVVDDGYRIAVDASAYVNDTDFLGTLDEQYGVWARHGAFISGNGSTICKSYGVLIDTLTNSCTTITNLYGLYQKESTAKNYFAGAVGIGTTQPAEKLDVRGDIAIQSGCFIGSGSTYGTSTAANYADFQIYDAATGFTNLNNQGFGIHLCTASTPRLTITNGGAVGIGTTAGTGTGCLFVGTPLTSGSAAIAQFNGLVRTDYIIAHNTGVSIHPDITCTGALGTGSKVFHAAFIKNIVSYGDHRPDTDDSHTLGTATCRWANVYATCTTTGAVIESNLCTQGIDSCPKGSVVVWRDGGLKGTTQEYDYNVMGVTAPGSDAPIVMGAEPILVTGDIKEGDPIVTSSKVNHGMKGDRSCDLHGKVIAQALENGSGESYIIQGMIRKF